MERSRRLLKRRLEPEFTAASHGWKIVAAGPTPRQTGNGSPRPGPSGSGRAGRSKSKGQSPKGKKQIPEGKRRRFRPGAKALVEIRKYQQTKNLLMQKLPFSLVVREVAMNIFPRHTELRWQGTAIMALQEAAEAFMVLVFENANLCAVHANRVAIMPKDLRDGLEAMISSDFTKF